LKRADSEISALSHLASTAALAGGFRRDRHNLFCCKETFVLGFFAGLVENGVAKSSEVGIGLNPAPFGEAGKVFVDPSSPLA
jgi:hypothetical protein